MLIYNPLNKESHVRVFGNNFTLKPQEIKMFQPAFAEFISRDKQETGLVALDDRFLDPHFKETDEGKEVLAEAAKQGIRNRVQYLERVYHNETASLQQDLDLKNMKTNPAVFMSDHTLELLRELKEYDQQKQNESKEKAKEVAKIKRDLGRI